MVSFDLNYSCHNTDPRPDWMNSERLDYCEHMSEMRNGLEEIQDFFRELFNVIR